MELISLNDKKTIELFFRKNTELHIYSIGDLDEFFWKYTTWYALLENKEIRAVALIYTAQSFSTLLALAEPVKPMKKLVELLIPELPDNFYSHLSPELNKVLENDFILDGHGKHYKMALKNISVLKEFDTSKSIQLNKEDLKEILQFYKECYPGNWFDPRMLETGQYYGIKKNNRLLSIAGIHVYSNKYKVAALGNIATHIDHKNKGYGKSVTAKVCQSLLKDVDHIGLNVKADNESAISCYEKLGFEIIGTYFEYMVERKQK